MPLNSPPKGPNSQSEMDRLTSFTTNVDSLLENFQNLNLNFGGVNSLGSKLADRSKLLKEMITRVNRPILVSLASEMLDTMASWFKSPEVLCCLIQAIYDMYIKKKELSYDPKTQFSIADTDFAKFLDTLIAFVDLIMVFLAHDIKKIVIFIPDFMKELTNAVLGAILLMLKETLYVLQDSVQKTIENWIDDQTQPDGNNPWLRCIPLQQMIDIIKKYINDYGMLATLNEKITGYVSGLVAGFGSLEVGESINQKIGDLQYLQWLRDVLVKLKNATLSYDVCIQWYYIPNPLDTPVSGPETVPWDYLSGGAENGNVALDANRTQNVIEHDDGTISINNQPRMTNNGIGDGNGVWRGIVAASTIKKLGSLYGFPEEVMNQAYARYTDGDLGTNVSPDSANQNQCAGIPSDLEFARFSKSNFQRNIYRN